MIKILAIDDSNIDLDNLNTILKNAFSDVIVLTARNGQDGIELAKSENPDMIPLTFSPSLAPLLSGFGLFVSVPTSAPWLIASW